MLQDHTAVSKQSWEGLDAVLGVRDAGGSDSDVVPAFVECKSLVRETDAGRTQIKTNNWMISSAHDEGEESRVRDRVAPGGR